VLRSSAKAGLGRPLIFYLGFIFHIYAELIVIGIGDIAARRVIPAIQAEPRSCLYGLVTRDLAKAAPYNVQAWTTLDEGLADPAVQSVYIATRFPPRATDDSISSCGKTCAVREADGDE